VITDTVGFIRDLPAELARAFRATLEEMADADLLVHVVDASDPDRDQHIRAVDGILADLELAAKPRFLVWNKCDRIPDAEVEQLVRAGGFAVSALDRSTFGPMLLAIERALWTDGKGELLPRVQTAGIA
jgi:GTP-binding protein HflX